MEKSNVEKVSEKICEENKKLRDEIEDKNCKIEEMRHHIERLKTDLEETNGDKKRFKVDGLKADLAEKNCDKIRLPHEPIKVAEMLIYEKITYETSSIAKAFGAGDMETCNLYSKSDLRQIAEHLLVYCNNSEDE